MMNTKILRYSIPIAILAMMTGTLASPSPVYAATYEVNTTDPDIEYDNPSPCNARHCSLWEAVITANMHPGPDRITFNLPGDGPHIINFASTEHPGLTFPWVDLWDDETEIDATTQPGWPVYLDGMGETGWAMVVHSSHNTIRGLGFLGFTESGLDILEGSENNFIDRVVVGDYLAGGFIEGPIGNNIGIRVRGDNNTLRGVYAANNSMGIYVEGSNQHIEDSLIGFISGSSARMANGEGIWVKGSETTIERNTIIGNYDEGIMVESDGNIIVRNRIGLDSSGHPLGNRIGISLGDLGGNRVGGINMYEGNIIGANDIGLYIISPGNQILNNRIGIDFGGAAFPNRIGVEIMGSSDDTTLGSGWIGAGNVIANNAEEGILLNSTENIVIAGNTIHNNRGNGIALRKDFLLPTTDGMKITISRNSIYNNGGQGIYIPDASFNNSVDHPTGLRFDSGAVSGQACAGCTVELFEAVPDPSGFGEGKTFLASATAESDGSFIAPVSGLGACSEITATATDGLGNTSDFSENVSAFLCFRLAPVMSLIWVLGSAGGWGLLVVGLVILRRRPRHLGPTATIGLGLLGGLLGAGIGIGLLAMPFVQVQWPQGQGSNQAPSSAPSCGEFLSQNLLQPADGAVFNPGTDVAIELSPQPDPPGMQTRWFLDVTGPGHKTVSKELTSTSLRLSELGFDPKQTGFYFWTLRGERSQAGSNLWTPLCTDTIQRMFQIAAPPATPLAETETTAPNANATSTATASPTQTLSPSGPTATLRQNANCRRGPGTEYDSVTNLPQGLTAPITGRNPDSSWWQVQVPGTQTRCWLAGENVDTSGDTGQVPIVEPEAIGCWVYDPNQQKNVCTVPCPQGAQPGGACTP
jgi:parallel beta-helix repeat protein